LQDPVGINGALLGGALSRGAPSTTRPSLRLGGEV
jgi:hypothetical protein